jgi:hypothetical protein
MVCEQMTRAKSKSAVAHQLVTSVVPLIVLILTLGITIRADGGSVLWQRTMGSITVTAFTTQSPLRPGPADISFFVENNEHPRPILEAQVFVTLQNETGVTMRTEATHAQARNKLLYCTLIDLPKPGHWKMTLLVVHAAERIEFVSDLAVSEPQSPLIANWRFIGFPFAIAILFIFQQRLAWKRDATHSESQQAAKY